MIAPGTQRYGAAVSMHPVASTAIGEAVGDVLDRVGYGPDVAVLFVSAQHRHAVGDMAAVVRAALGVRTLIGATASAVIGGRDEVEAMPAVSLWAGRCGPVRPVRLDAFRDANGYTVAGLPQEVDRGEHTLVLLADPTTFPTDAFLRQVNVANPQLQVIGGLASAGDAGGNRLVLDDLLLDDAAVGFVVGSGVARTVVSQGCRPIGDPFTVTRAEGNFVGELGGRPAMDRLQELIDAATPEERLLLRRGLHIGIVINDRHLEYGPGDFLVRNVLGAQRSTGAVAVGDLVNVGATVQFHVRDAVAAHDELCTLLDDEAAESALLFTCNGRGMALFGEANHDAVRVADAVNADTVAGMFCAGEIGPVGGRNYLHGFTAAVALFDQ